MRSSKATSVPRSASSVMAPSTSAVAARFSADSKARLPTASMACVPVMSEMRQRSQVTACAHAALRRNHRMNFAADHLTKQVDDISTYPGEPFGQRVGAQHHHCACLSLAERFAY